MALRTTPPGEDPLRGTRGLPVSFSSPGTPPDDGARGRFAGKTGNGGFVRDNRWRGMAGVDQQPEPDELENQAADDAENPPELQQDIPDVDFLGLVRIAEQQAQLYTAQVNRRAWSQSLRAFHNEHFVGSKYTKPEWRNRSRLFVPKTRAAVRKDMAAVSASLFNSIDAVTCLPGNESDPKQRAAASVMEELVNYRTDTTSGKAGIPWFLVAMGARQDALLTGLCLTKQFWKLEYRKIKDEHYLEAGQDGAHVRKVRTVYEVAVDRPEILNFPPENFVIHSGADWRNPVQTASFIILKYPMTYDEIRQKQDSPVNPWHDLTEAQLRGASVLGKQDMEAIRRAREVGLDRYDETQTGTEFQVIWVYEVFMRIGGEDWQFWTIGDQFFLTDPKPTSEAYPEQFGERPLALGYGALESHRIFPMAPVESWQPLQVEVNDLRNLQLDAIKQNVMPISKVKRGKRIDLDQVRRRSFGSSIMVDDPADVTWEQAPQLPQDSTVMNRELNIEMDDLAGVQNYGNVENNQALGKTLGGLKLAAGAANAVQEFDIRVWLMTWAEPSLTQLMRLEQYYENDATVLGLCGQRAQLFEKFGIDQIDDNLLEQQITMRVSVGLGAGDPQQRLAKFATAAQTVAPILMQSPDFQSGKRKLNIDAIIEEVFGAVGYKDGGDRFFIKDDNAQPNPMGDLQMQAIQAKIEKDKKQGQASMLTGLAAVAKIALGKRELEADVVDMILGHQQDARAMGHEHAMKHHETVLSAADHGFRHGLDLRAHHHQVEQDVHGRQMAENEAGRAAENDAHARQMAERSATFDEQQAQQQGEGAGTGRAASPQPPRGGAARASPSGSPPAPSPQVKFVRGSDGKISHAVLPPGMSLAPVHQPSGGNEDRMARMEAMIAHLARKRTHRVLRNERGDVAGFQEE
jgi:hypothetical protein